MCRYPVGDGAKRVRAGVEGSFSLRPGPYCVVPAFVDAYLRFIFLEMQTCLLSSYREIEISCLRENTKSLEARHESQIHRVEGRALLVNANVALIGISVWRSTFSNFLDHHGWTNIARLPEEVFNAVARLDVFSIYLRVDHETLSRNALVQCRAGGKTLAIAMCASSCTLENHKSGAAFASNFRLKPSRLFTSRTFKFQTTKTHE